MPGLTEKESKETLKETRYSESITPTEVTQPAPRLGIPDMVFTNRPEHQFPAYERITDYPDIYTRQGVRHFYPVVDGILSPVPSYGLEIRPGVLSIASPLVPQLRRSGPMEIGRGGYGFRVPLSRRRRREYRSPSPPRDPISPRSPRRSRRRQRSPQPQQAEVEIFDLELELVSSDVNNNNV